MLSPLGLIKEYTVYPMLINNILFRHFIFLIIVTEESKNVMTLESQGIQQFSFSLVSSFSFNLCHVSRFRIRSFSSQLSTLRNTINIRYFLALISYLSNRKTKKRCNRLGTRTLAFFIWSLLSFFVVFLPLGLIVKKQSETLVR